MLQEDFFVSQTYINKSAIVEQSGIIILKQAINIFYPKILKSNF